MLYRQCAAASWLYRNCCASRRPLLSFESMPNVDISLLLLRLCAWPVLASALARAFFMRYSSWAAASLSPRLSTATLCLLNGMPSFCSVGCMWHLTVKLGLDSLCCKQQQHSTWCTGPNATCLQASVVVEYSCRSCTVHKLTEVWLQVALGQNLAKDISTCQVLQQTLTGQQGLARTGKVRTGCVTYSCKVRAI